MSQRRTSLREETQLAYSRLKSVKKKKPINNTYHFRPKHTCSVLVEIPIKQLAHILLWIKHINMDIYNIMAWEMHLEKQDRNRAMFPCYMDKLKHVYKIKRKC